MVYNDKELLCIAFAEAEASGTIKALNTVRQLDSIAQLKVKLKDKAFINTFSDKGKALINIIKGDYLQKALSNYEDNDIRCVTYFSDKYPEQLKHYDDAPLCLYCKGNVSLLNANALAVVGTRKPNAYGRRVAENFVRVLAEKFVIVSGLAYGIDSIAHQTTLTVHGKTIAVLGSGLGVIYPQTNTELARNIVSSGGLIVSEYPFNAEPKTYHFPQRNRIVSGLSQGVLVCQSPLKSGTAVTVQLALEQGKDIFVVPGEIYDYGFLGSNKLIKSMQGAMVTDPLDIVDYYHITEIQSQPQQLEMPILTVQEQAVADLLIDGQKHLNDIVGTLKILPKDALILLASMELKGIITKLAGNFYRWNGGN